MEDTKEGVACSAGTMTTVRLEGLQRLKALHAGGQRAESTMQIKIEDPIYDVVKEDEYDMLVARHREEVWVFIIDKDDLLGYANDSEDEDWTRHKPDCSFGKKKRP